LLAELFGSWKAWCDANGEKYGSARALADLLEEAEFPPKRGTNGKRAHEGLYLVNQPSAEEPLL